MSPGPPSRRPSGSSCRSAGAPPEFFRDRTPSDIADLDVDPSRPRFLQVAERAGHELGNVTGSPVPEELRRGAGEEEVGKAYDQLRVSRGNATAQLVIDLVRRKHVLPCMPVQSAVRSADACIELGRFSGRGQADTRCPRRVWSTPCPGPFMRRAQGRSNFPGSP